MAKKKNNNTTNKKGGSASSTGAVASADDIGEDGTTATDTKNNNDETEIEVDEENEIEEIELELYQVDLGDMMKIKQVMDETVAGCIIENHTVPEDYKWDNIKLGVMIIACTFAMIAQMIPPSPFNNESRHIIGICGILYFVFSTILQCITTFIDKDSILWTLPMIDTTNIIKTNTSNKTVTTKEDSNNSITNPLMKQYGFTVRTSLKQYTEWYTVTIEFYIPKGKELSTNNNTSSVSSSPPFVQQRWSIAQFFDKDGYFDETGVMEEIDKLYIRFVLQQYDTVKLGDVPPPKRKQE